jgi:hypothetical protein
MSRHPISLSGPQLKVIMEAARQFSLGSTRSCFLADVADQLTGLDRIGDPDVTEAVSQSLRRFRPPSAA